MLWNWAVDSSFAGRFTVQFAPAGGTSGVGIETVRVLALRGAYVFIAARNYDKYLAAKEKILESNSVAQIDYLNVDLANLASVRKAASEFLATKLPLNILV